MRSWGDVRVGGQRAVSAFAKALHGFNVTCLAVVANVFSVFIAGIVWSLLIALTVTRPLRDAAQSGWLDIPIVVGFFVLIEAVAYVATTTGRPRRERAWLTALVVGRPAVRGLDGGIERSPAKLVAASCASNGWRFDEEDKPTISTIIGVNVRVAEQAFRERYEAGGTADAEPWSDRWARVLAREIDSVRYGDIVSSWDQVAVGWRYRLVLQLVSPVVKLYFAIGVWLAMGPAFDGASPLGVFQVGFLFTVFVTLLVYLNLVKGIGTTRFGTATAAQHEVLPAAVLDEARALNERLADSWVTAERVRIGHAYHEAVRRSTARMVGAAGAVSVGVLVPICAVSVLLGVLFTDMTLTALGVDYLRLVGAALIIAAALPLGMWLALVALEHVRSVIAAILGALIGVFVPPALSLLAPGDPNLEQTIIGSLTSPVLVAVLVMLAHKIVAGKAESNASRPASEQATAAAIDPAATPLHGIQHSRQP